MPSKDFSSLTAQRPKQTSDMEELELAKAALAAGRVPLAAVPTPPQEPEEKTSEVVQVQSTEPAKVIKPKEPKARTPKPAESQMTLVPKSPEETARPGTKQNPKTLKQGPNKGLKKAQGSIHFEAALYEAMEYACVRLKCSKSEAVNEALARWLNDPSRRATVHKPKKRGG
jgi:outer membrane biosynthesis protein TonB